MWHAGERRLQESAGTAARMAVIGPRVVRDHMPAQHQAFFAQLPFLVVGSVDARDDAWATLLAERPGFVRATTPTSLEIHARPDPGDPAGDGLRPGHAVGLLGIELHTRRRNRANGQLRAGDDDALHVAVTQSFGNCPQYIHLRDAAWVDDDPRAGEVEVADALDVHARATIAQADTFFVATWAERDDRREVDVSHRGGAPGFVQIDGDDRLVIPDYSGNQFFSTLGNIACNGRAGLVFVDFATGDLLQLTGDARVILDDPAIDAFAGAERLWTFHPRRLVRRRAALPLRWTARRG
ncbi:MAG: pyridoxamine 5'-phosphate oxidase family protein [Polyangiales bacterium]